MSTMPRRRLSFATPPLLVSILYKGGLVKNPDGTVDVYFAPKAPAGHEANWILTRENKPFFVMFRIYGPEKGVVDGSWILNNIEMAH